MVGPKLATDEYPEDRSETSSVRKLPDEYPLEYMAKSIAKARSWKIICNPTDGFYHPSTIPEFNSGSINQAARAVTVWRELKRISGDAWHPESAAVHRVTKALGEAMARTMNHVFSSNGSVSVIPSKSDISSFDCEFKILTDPDSGRYDTIRLNLLTRDKTDGKWNNWRANGFEPLLYLWVHQLRHENVPSNGQSIWLLGPGDDEVMAEILSTWWISREGSCFLVNDLQQTVRELGINKSMVINCPGTESTRFPRQGVLQMSDLEEVCGQYIFHTFFRSLVKIFSPIAGGNTKPQFSIRRAIPTPMILANDDVGELVELIRHPDLMSLDGAYRTVVLALFEVGSLPWWDALDPDCLTKIVESLNKEPLSLQEEARKQILYMCKKRAKELMRLKSFEKAGKIYSAAMLSFEKSRWFSSVSQLSEQLDELALSLNGDMVNKYQSRINSLNQSVGPFPLHNAVREGSVQDVCFQISLRTRVTDKSTLEVIDNAKMSMTPLALAAWHGFSDVVAVLLLYGADGSTALHHAAETGFDDMVPQLLRNGVNPNSYNPRGWAALHLAVDRRNQKMIELLIENGANIEKETDRDGNTALTLAILKGYENMVRLLLEKGADMERVGAEESPLLLASNTGHEGIFRLLLSYGANVQRVDGEGMTVLHRACVHKAGNIVKLLLGGKHSDHLKDSIDNKRRTPLELTVADNNLPIIRLLLRGARTGSHLDKVKRSLMVACAQGFDETVRLLVDHGAQVNSREMDGRTPLYFAVVHGRESTLRLLLDAGADANAPESSSGLTAMELARMFNNEGVIRILENRV